MRRADGQHEGSQDGWVGRIRAGDAAAFEELFRTYYNALCVFAESRIGSAEDAEDIVEEVLFRIWRARERWHVRGSLKAYLYRAVKNESLKRIEHRQVVRRSEAIVKDDSVVPAMGSRPASPDDRMQAVELAEAAREAIADLPERCRQAYTLHRQHGLRYAEIAEIMGVSRKTVENHLARAVKTLRQRLAAWLP